MVPAPVERKELWSDSLKGNMETKYSNSRSRLTTTKHGSAICNGHVRNGSTCYAYGNVPIFSTHGDGNWWTWTNAAGGDDAIADDDATTNDAVAYDVATNDAIIAHDATIAYDAVITNDAATHAITANDAATHAIAHAATHAATHAVTNAATNAATASESGGLPKYPTTAVEYVWTTVAALEHAIRLQTLNANVVEDKTIVTRNCLLHWF